MEYFLEMKNITKSFPGVKVLDDVTLRVRAGEVHALMGENGAGKSTLMKILMGIYKADEGSILINGSPVTIQNPRDAMGKGISMMHQELNTVLDMDAAENIFIGREPQKSKLLNLIDREKMLEDTHKYFKELEIGIDPKAPMRSLSVAQMQLVEIVKAISADSKIIVMDEPTSAITEKEAVILFRQIERLKKQGVAIIYISHKMDEIFKISDTITVLRDGRLICTKPACELTDNELIRFMVGREITEIYPKEESSPGQVIMEVKNISRGRLVKDVSFRLRAGEVLGIAGLVGAGRSELAETIFGLHPKTGGEILLDGKKINIWHPRDAIEHKIALITEDRKLTGLNLSANVKENISLAALSSLAKFGVIDQKQESTAANRYIKELGIKTPSENTAVNKLSGGNQQKVVLAKWLLADPRIIILDEPTRGIDVGSKRDIYLLINGLAKQGKAIILISSEMPEVMGISDRILVMCEGMVTGEISRRDFSQELIMKYASLRKGEQPA